MALIGLSGDRTELSLHPDYFLDVDEVCLRYSRFIMVSFRFQDRLFPSMTHTRSMYNPCQKVCVQTPFSHQNSAHCK